MINFLYTIQRPLVFQGRTIPGYMQIDILEDGDNTRSSNLVALRSEGINLPDLPDHFPTGQYLLNDEGHFDVLRSLAAA
jgi:hypothetical protein